MRPLAVDLFCGVGGWTAGLLAEGFDAIGFDVERHSYDGHEYPAQLVLQDVTTLHGSQFRDAALIVASPPCQSYSYMAMPWTRAKDLAKWYADPDHPERVAELNALFNACFRIQAEASAAAGRHIPMVVENVRGAQPWVGRSRWNFGSYHLWGDVPALMPATPSVPSGKGAGGIDLKGVGPLWTAVQAGAKSAHWTNPLETGGKKRPGHDWSRFKATGEKSEQWNEGGGVEHHGSGAVWFDTGPASLSSGSPRRKAASAMIAKIPLPLATYIASVYRPPRRLFS